MRGLVFALALAAAAVAAPAGRAADAPAPAPAPPTVPVNPWWDHYREQARLVALPDGRRMNILCQGVGSPTVIFDSGLGGGAWDWRAVHLQVARTTRACAYDRAGYGGSDPGPLPRDAKALVADLEALLRAAAIKGPYVVVGHSMGGPTMRLFTDRNRAQVIGMVLVDPSSEHQIERFTAAAPQFVKLAGDQEPVRQCLAYLQAGPPDPAAPLYKQCVPDPPADMPEASRPLHYAYVKRPQQVRTVIAEWEGLRDFSSAEIDATRRPYGDLPLIVLTADNQTGAQLGAAEAAALTALWRKMHDEQAALSTRGVNRLVPNSNHYIQFSQPQAVIDAVNEVIAAARRR